MIFENCKVVNNGSHYVASIPYTWSKAHGGYSPRREDSILFDEYYQKAQIEGISDKRIASYVESEIRRERDIEDWISEERCSELLKNKRRSVHKCYKRYEGKLMLTPFNWYVTFTYDDDKSTPEAFQKRLKKCFSNFKCRKNWRVVGVPEDGEEKGRRHWHCFIHIPEGMMVGKLFLNKAFSTKRKKYETWTDNEYFNKRFGNSVWKAITPEDLRHGGELRRYLVKYLQKSGHRMFYSRGLPHELRVDVNTETDVACTYFDYGYKSVLFNSVIDKDLKEKVEKSDNNSYVFPVEKGHGFNVKELMKKYLYPIQYPKGYEPENSWSIAFDPILLY